MHWLWKLAVAVVGFVSVAAIIWVAILTFTGKTVGEVARDVAPADSPTTATAGPDRELVESGAKKRPARSAGSRVRVSRDDELPLIQVDNSRVEINLGKDGDKSISISRDDDAVRYSRSAEARSEMKESLAPNVLQLPDLQIKQRILVTPEVIAPPEVGVHIPASPEPPLSPAPAPAETAPSKPSADWGWRPRPSSKVTRARVAKPDGSVLETYVCEAQYYVYPRERR